MARKRDYAAEYARRLARAAEKGYSKSVARGHAPKGTVSITRAKQLKVPPGFVIFRAKPRKGFKATAKSRTENIRKLGYDPRDVTSRIRSPFKERNPEVIRLMKEGLSEQAAIRQASDLGETTTADQFAELLQQAGFTEREAFTLWFS